MRIAFVTKRYYTNQDLIEERFGRLFHLPVALAASGHEVMVVAVDYRSALDSESADVAGVRFVSLPLKGRAFLRFWSRLRSHVDAFEPDVVVGSSDTHFGWMAARLAKRARILFVFDLYDNYLAFASRRVPGFEHLFRRVVAAADLVTVVSQPLVDMVSPHASSVAEIANGVDRNLFHPLHRDEARSFAGLENHGDLVGYVGSIEPERGIEELIEAVDRIRSEGHDVDLVLAGTNKLGGNWAADWVHYLGRLPQDRIPAVINSCNIVVLPYLSDDWGRYTYPNKLAEYVACGVPVVATNLPQFAAVLDDRSLCRPGDAAAMAAAIAGQLSNPSGADPQRVSSWEEIAATLAAELEHL